MFRIPDTAQDLTPRRTGVAVGACLAVAALVAGCGGGDRVKSFQPSQIIAFGDESSAFDDTANASSGRVVDFGTTGVPYAARYTINVIADAGFLCKNAKPNNMARAGCVDINNDGLTAADFPTATSFFLPQTSEIQYRLDSGLPVIGEVVTGALTEAVSGTPNPVYRTVDHYYYCSTDYGIDNGNWVQRLAHGLGGGALSLGGSSGCAQDFGNGRSHAAWGAKVDDVATQVNNHLGELRDGVLVTMLAGQNDIMAAYDSVVLGSITEDAAQKLMRDKGAQLAGVINRVVDTGARVVYLTVPNMGVSPKAVAGGRQALATALTRAFNDGYKGIGEGNESGGLVLSVRNNGHKIVKVDGYNLIAGLAPSYSSSPVCQTDANLVTRPDGTTVAAALAGTFGSDVTSAAYLDAKAKALLLNCTSNNLIITSGNYAATPPTNEVRADYIYYLWADDQRLAPIGHGNLANLAIARIRDQL